MAIIEVEIPKEKIWPGHDKKIERALPELRFAI